MLTINFHIKGIAPMLQHSDATANPFNPFTKELKAMTSKRKKTEDDLWEIARIEWEAGLYHNDKGYYIPAANFESNLLASAKQFKLGTTIKQAMLVPTDGTFKFKDDNLKPIELFKLKEYVDMRTVKIMSSKLTRTRPIFNEWESKFTVFLDEDKMDKAQLVQVVENAGKYVGLGDYRPRYGRYEVVKVK